MPRRNPIKLLQEVETRLLEEIPKQVKSAKIREPVYCLVLGYHGESPFPPHVCLGAEEFREGVVEEEGKEAKHIIWNFEELDYPVELKDRALLKKCEELNEDIDPASNVATDLLNRVAAKLMQRDWSKELTVTEDFVVVATDEENSDLKENMKASLPRSLLAKLKKAGLV